MSDIAITFTIVVAIVGLFVWNRIPVVIVALGTALALWATGVLDLGQALGGLGDPAVIFIASLFVVSAGLDATGVTAWAGQLLIAQAGESRARLLVLVGLLVSLLTALISVNGAVAALLPVVIVTAIRLGRPTSQLLMPLVFSAHAGSMLALTGTPVNVLVSEAALEAGVGGFGYFEFAIVGIPLLLGTLAIIVVLGERLLPDRSGRSMPSDLSRHAHTQVEQYRLDDAQFQLDAVFNRTTGLAEVVIPPRSELVGKAMFPGMVTPSGDLIVRAIQRKGENQGPDETVLAVGDTLLLQGPWQKLDHHLADPDVLVVDAPDLVRRQAVPMGVGAKQAIAVLLGMVLLLATGLVPPVIAGLLAACAMVLCGVLSVEQSYRAINWTTVILVGAMMPLSTAMSQSGAAALMADRLVALVGDGSPYALLGGLFVLTAILGQLISNTATALIIIPIAVAAAVEVGISPRPVLMSVTVAAAASFLTPVATPVNLMVMGPGGYAFGDYWKLGLPLMLWFFVVATFVVPMFWSF